MAAMGSLPPQSFGPPAGPVQPSPADLQRMGITMDQYQRGIANAAGSFRKGGAVAIEDSEGDSPKAKGDRERQWGDVGDKPVEIPEKKAKGGVIKHRLPARKKAKALPVPMVTDEDMGPPPQPPPPPPTGPVPVPVAAPPVPPPGMAKGGKWIQKAVSKPGALHKQLGVPEGEKIPAETLKGLHKADGGVLAKGRGVEDEADDKMAVGGVAKLRKGFPDTKVKKMAKGGRVRGSGIAEKGCDMGGITEGPDKMATGGRARGCGIAQKGCGFSGVY
jgi:hypothetical protein